MPPSSSIPTSVIYNVVGFPQTNGGSFGVRIDDKIIKLNTSPETFPLWSAVVPESSTSSAYQYVELSAQGTVVRQEPFLRSFQDKSANSTVNEFFLRKVTRATLPEIPQVYKDVRPEPSKAFDHSQIATIHITAKPDDFEELVGDPPVSKEQGRSIKGDFRFINADTVYSSQARIKLKLSGRDSVYYKKLSFRIKFDNGDTFFNRPIVKLRSCVFDPTMMCEKLYIDVLNAIGVRTAQAAWVRLYLNQNPLGFFLMVEDIELPFVRETIHNGSGMPPELGSFFKMSDTRSQEPADNATLQYLGPTTKSYNEDVYKKENLGANPPGDPMAQLIALFKDLRDFDPSQPDSVKFWNLRLDLDGFLRCMAMEFLGGVWDGYWYAGNNFLMYFNPTENRWLFIPTDFDRAFSDGNLPDVLTTYEEFAQIRLTKTGKDHPLVTKLILKNKEINQRFETVLHDIVKGVFNLEKLGPRIDAYETMIADEVAWDYSLDRSKDPGFNFNFTTEDFHAGLFGSVTKSNSPVDPKNNKDSKDNIELKQGIKPWIKSRAEYVSSVVAG
ncbi:hypothetical protein BGZ73_008632 [Actinomortierella ambigua]|nr:hypothetical protein BGZ73_008632 [Actinomortierella ambigua]